MPILAVDGYTVTFPEGWTVGKFDEWTFYTKHFQKLQDGIQAMDVIAVSPDGAAYLIEFKDYHDRRRDKVEAIDAEFIGKILSTLAAMLPAACNARNTTERSLARLFLNATSIRLVLHLDQSRPGNRLFPPIVDATNLTLKLRTRLRAIGPRTKLTSLEDMAGLPWTVARTRPGTHGVG